MKNTPRSSRQTHSYLCVSFGCGLLLALLLASGCGGLAGEPDIVATFPAPTAIAEVGFPQQPPDLALGAQLYLDNCTRCHGADGRGEGEFVLSGQIARPPDFTDPATAGVQTPTEWYAIITNGRLDKGMPPWSRALDAQQRWSVAMYTYTLAYTPDLLAQGQQIWQANCVSCHGETGRGDGPQAAEIGAVGDLTAQVEMVSLSDDAVVQIVTQGRDNMPAFAELDDSARRAVATYVRTLALSGSDLIGQAVEPAATPEVDSAQAEPTAIPEVASAITGQITGHVINGTSGAVLPQDFKVILVIHDAGNIERWESTVGADGSYTFADVSIQPENTYFVTADYNNRRFLSDIAMGSDVTLPLDLPLTIYETTNDPSVISITQLLSRVRPTTISGLEGLEVTQLFVFNNSSDRMFSTDTSVAEEVYQSLTIALPRTAEIIGVDDPQRYVRATDVVGVVDTEPVLPGEHVAQITYFLPYRDSVSVEQPITYGLDGQVRFMLAPDSLTLTADSFGFTGQQTSENETYQIYDGQLAIAAGDSLRFQVSGSVSTSSSSSQPSSNVLSIVLVVGGIGLVTAGAVVYVWDKRRSSADKQRQIDSLVSQIAELDEAREVGQIHDKVYQRQRSQLKARLAELMGEPKDQ